MAHGATRKIRRAAERNWLDLRDLDKRQQRRAVRRAAARSRGRFLVASPKFDPLLIFGRDHRRFIASKAIGMAVLYDTSRVFVKGSMS